MAAITIEEKLRERVKELTCLYDITSIILLHDDSPARTLADICQIVKNAYLHAADAIVELDVLSHSIATDDLPVRSVSQSAKIELPDERQGLIRVHYPAPQYDADDFLEEEHQLLQKVASEISGFFDKIDSAEKQLQMQRSIERADRLTILGEIAAGIAHELNTPLGNILGFAELIQKQNKNHQIDQDLLKIINAAIHSREIVKKMMFFSCEMPQRLEQLEITPVILEALALLGPNFKKKQLRYAFNAPDAAIKSTIDSIQFTQVLFNILINAIYASPTQATISIDVVNEQGNVLIKISDCGPGIPPEQKPRIFEPFYTTKPIGEGTGLGLSVVHGILKSHKGSISIADNVPSGAIFEIRLPTI
ncbi:sensor histidine kinase [Flavobacterium selenitireducens]|uniref:sensor histidine kinase n=1 Tax=Flavobacterium selenitireducens TaxID=2722704 RepID=UPI00168A4BAB|nr:ATP-binding protein [Flavobacterium selenitireducens]MBD3581253.1 GHKL domain-containing protein [Flavobacterium selenitireducens]